MKNLLVLIVLVFLVFIVSISQTSAQTIYACYNNHSGAMRYVTGPTMCKKSETQISWNAEGSPGVSGYEIVKGHQTLAPETAAIVGAQCSPGKKVLGGGFFVEYPPDILVHWSGPIDSNSNISDQLWSIFVRNIGALDRQVEVYGICATMQ